MKHISFPASHVCQQNSYYGTTSARKSEEGYIPVREDLLGMEYLVKRGLGMEFVGKRLSDNSL